LTANQELFVAMVATEQIKMRARLAGAEVKEGPRRKGRKGEDPYGKVLARRKEMQALDSEFRSNPVSFERYTKPL
jgi:hypothetical protein